MARSLLAIVSTLVLGQPALADDDLEAAQREALRGSQAALTDPAQRAEAAKDPEAARAMRMLEGLAGNPQASQKMYELAAELMGTLVRETNGDPDKMLLLLENGRTNPAAFGGRLTPEQRKTLSDLARAIEAAKKNP
jgi:hypothetical protein